MNNTLSLPAPADEIVSDFIDEICSIQPQFVHSVYLTGSLSMNDFYPNKSDIDFIVLCKELPEGRTATQLKHIHKIIKRHYPKSNLSGSYLAFDSIQKDKPEAIKALTYHEGCMRHGNLEMAPVSLSELKSNAITVLGMIAGTLPINISVQCLNRFLHDNINSYWTKWIARHASFFNRKILLLLFPRFTEWAVLGVARQLCTLQTGKIVSKKEAGYYCLQQLPARFHPIIKEAIDIRKDTRTYPFLKSYTIRISFKRAIQTIECVNYIIALFNKTYNEARQ